MCGLCVAIDYSKLRSQAAEYSVPWPTMEAIRLSIRRRLGETNQPKFLQLAPARLGREPASLDREHPRLSIFNADTGQTRPENLDVYALSSAQLRGLSLKETVIAWSELDSAEVPTLASASTIL